MARRGRGGIVITGSVTAVGGAPSDNLADISSAGLTVIASTVVLVLVVRGTRRVVARAREEVAAGTRPAAG